MKLKHVLFSSLFLSAALVACTNDEFEEMQAPAVDTAEAISLGEGFTISGAKVAMNPATKSFFEEGANGIEFNWEEDDILGAAWFNAIKEDGIGLDGYVRNGYTKPANSDGNFAWNVDFHLDRFVGEDQGSAYFTANTNVSAGAFVMYSPWDENISAEFSAIPVELKFPYTVNLAEGHEYDAVNENMFSYGVAAFVPGGRQTDKFSLNQVPVLYGLQLGIDRLKLVDLDNMHTIDRIVIEAYDASGNTVLTTKGEVTPPTEEVTARKYNDYIDFIANNDNDWSENPLPKAKYTGIETAKVGHYTIALDNSNQEKYQISTLKDQLTDRIIFSSLPIMGEATKLVVKVITDKGITLVKTFDANAKDAAEKALALETLASFNKAQEEGALVTLKVRVDSQSDDNIVYTPGQFQEQWDVAIAANTPKTITVADPVILEDITLECTNPQADVTIKLDESQVAAALSLKAINVERGKVTIECPVNVSGNINSSANLDIQGAVTAKDIILNGNSNTMMVAAMNKLEVRESGKVTLVLPTNRYAAANIGAIEVYQSGQLTVSKGMMNGPVKVYNNGVFTINGNVTNLKSFEGKVKTGDDGKFINAEGATATLAAGSNAVVNNQAGGIMYLNGGVKAGSENSGNIYVLSGELDVANLAQTTTGITTIEKSAKVQGTNTTMKGWVVIKDMASRKTLNIGSNNNILAYRVESADDFEQKSGISNYFLFADVKMKGMWNYGDLYIFTDQTIEDNFNTDKEVYVRGDIKFSVVDPEKPKTFTLTGYGKLEVDGKLYLNEGVNLATQGNDAYIEKNSYTRISAYNWNSQVVANNPNVK